MESGEVNSLIRQLVRMAAHQQTIHTDLRAYIQRLDATPGARQGSRPSTSA